MVNAVAARPEVEDEPHHSSLPEVAVTSEAARHLTQLRVEEEGEEVEQHWVLQVSAVMDCCSSFVLAPCREGLQVGQSRLEEV